MAGVYVRLHGEEAPRVLRAEAEVQRRNGNAIAEARALKDAQEAEELLRKADSERIQRASINPSSVALFGALVGVESELDRFELSDSGIVIRRTFVHVTAPYLLAFSPPAKPGQPHPPPWRPASGGVSFDAVVEIALPETVQISGFDRINSLWWLTALLRLKHATGIRMPVVSNLAFSDAASAQNEPVFWSLEMSDRQFAFDGPAPNTSLTLATFEWMKKHVDAGASMMAVPSFNMAFLALDHAHWARTRGTAKLLIWSSLEALFRPGRHRTTHNLAAAIATYLETSRSAKDRRYADVKTLYEARGQVTHAAEEPTIDDVVSSFRLARLCFTKAIEQRSMPETSDLLTLWPQGDEASNKMP